MLSSSEPVKVSNSSDSSSDWSESLTMQAMMRDVRAEAEAEGMEVVVEVEEEEGVACWLCADSDALMAASICVSSLASTMLLTCSERGSIENQWKKCS